KDAKIPLLIGTDQEGGNVNRLFTFHGNLPSAAEMAGTRGSPVAAISAADGRLQCQPFIYLSWQSAVGRGNGCYGGSTRTLCTRSVGGKVVVAIGHQCRPCARSRCAERQSSCTYTADAHVWK